MMVESDVTGCTLSVGNGLTNCNGLQPITYNTDI